MSVVITNAASSGVTIDRKRLKSLARRSDAFGLAYLASWAAALALTGFSDLVTPTWR